MTKDKLDEILDALLPTPDRIVSKDTGIQYDNLTLIGRHIIAKAKEQAKAKILKHYLPIDQVKEAIESQDSTIWATKAFWEGQKKLRKEIKERLGIE